MLDSIMNIFLEESGRVEVRLTFEVVVEEI